MQRANETLMQRIRPVQAETSNLVEDTTGPSIRTFDNENTSQNEACFELDENHVGIAIEMNLILAPEDQIKVIVIDFTDNDGEYRQHLLLFFFCYLGYDMTTESIN